jgi:glycosyltransferase involved in cell wall biosynthesis
VTETEPKRRPRLIFVVESGTDLRLVNGLADRFDLELVCRAIPNGHTINHPPSSQVPTELGPSSRLSFALFVLGRLRRQPSFDVVLVQGYALAALVANLWGRFARTRTAMLVCSPVERYYLCRREDADPSRPFRGSAYAGLRLLAAANAIVGRQYVALSSYLADVLKSHGASCRIDVVPVYGVNTHVFRPASRPSVELKAELGLPTTGAILLFSSRVAPEKDAKTLLEAFRLTLTKGTDAWLVNRSGGFEAFRRIADEVGVGHRVIAGGPLHPTSELPILYQAVDICIQASRDEGLGFSALEALASGTPVIASSVGGLRETVVDGETGWSYEKGDAVGLASAIHEVLSNPEEARRRALAGRAIVEARFEEATVFERLKRVLTETPSS